MNIKLNLTFFLIPLFITAQITFKNPEGGAVSFLTKNKDYSDAEAKGSPYLNTEFEKGGVYVRNKLEIQGELRYNAYKSEIEVSENDASYFSLLKRPYITAEIGDKVFKMFNYKDEKSLDRVAYFNPMNVGEIVLLFKPEIRLKRGKVPSTSYDKYIPPTYVDISTYYIKIGEQPAQKIFLQKKTFLKLLKDKKDLVSSFIKENNLKLTRSKDAVTILNYYNNL